MWHIRFGGGVGLLGTLWCRGVGVFAGVFDEVYGPQSQTQLSKLWKRVALGRSVGVDGKHRLAPRGFPKSCVTIQTQSQEHQF